MKYIYILIVIFLTLTLQISCGSLNKAEGQLHYNNNVTKGRELLDLKKALDEGAINEDEYELMKNRIINDEYIKSFFRQLDEIDEDDYDSVSI